MGRTAPAQERPECVCGFVMVAGEGSESAQSGRYDASLSMNSSSEAKTELKQKLWLTFPSINQQT